MHASTLRKKVFSRVSVKFISLHGSNNSDSVPFESGAFGEIKDHGLRTRSFPKKISYGSLRYMSILRRKVFLGAPLKCYSLDGWNDSDSLVFGNAAFEEIKDHGLRTTHFQNKKNLLWKF